MASKTALLHMPMPTLDARIDSLFWDELARKVGNKLHPGSEEDAHYRRRWFQLRSLIQRIHPDLSDSALNTATDQRFWQELKEKNGKRLDPGNPDDQQYRERWLQIRQQFIAGGSAPTQNTQIGAAGLQAQSLASGIAAKNPGALQQPGKTGDPWLLTGLDATMNFVYRCILRAYGDRKLPPNPHAPVGDDRDQERETVRAFLYDVYGNHPLTRALIDHYFYPTDPIAELNIQQGGEVKLTTAQMREINPDVSVGTSKPFQRAVEQLYRRGGGRRDGVYFEGDGGARTSGTLGGFTAKYKGSIIVAPDGAWQFEGVMSFFDRWDFDSQIGKDSRRSKLGEIRTAFGRQMPGTPFIVTSDEVPVRQQKGNPRVLWGEQAGNQLTYHEFTPEGKPPQAFEKLKQNRGPLWKAAKDEAWARGVKGVTQFGQWVAGKAQQYLGWPTETIANAGRKPIHEDYLAEDEQKKYAYNDGDLTGPYYPRQYMAKRLSDPSDALGSQRATIYINGMITSLKEHVNAARLLADQLGERPVVGIFNATAGFRRDLMQSSTDKAGIGGLWRRNPATITLVDVIQRYGKPSAEKGGLDIIAHSQGAAIVSEALRQVRKEDRSQVDVTTLGGAAWTRPEGVRGYHNYVFDSDAVPTLVGASSPIGLMLRNRYGGALSAFGMRSAADDTVSLHNTSAGLAPHAVGGYIKALPQFREKEKRIRGGQRDHNESELKGMVGRAELGTALAGARWAGQGIAGVAQSAYGKVDRVMRWMPSLPFLPSNSIWGGIDSGLRWLGRGVQGAGEWAANRADRSLEGMSAVQRSGQGDHPDVDAADLRQHLLRQEGSGFSPDRNIRGQLGAHTGFDPGIARFHTGPAAAAAAQRLNAEAFTVGRDVYFGAGRFDPSSRAGLGLIAHEVTHVGQQTGITGDQARFFSRQGGDDMEREAQQTRQMVLANAGNANGLLVEEYHCDYECEDGLSEDDVQRLDRISLQALDMAGQRLTVLGITEEHLGTIECAVELDIERLNDQEAMMLLAEAIIRTLQGKLKVRSARNSPTSVAIQKAGPVASEGDVAKYLAHGRRGEGFIAEHLIPGAVQKWIGMFGTGKPESVAAKVIAEATGQETSYYTKSAYRNTLTVILTKATATLKTKEDLKTIALVRDLALAGGLSPKDLKMIYDGQRQVIKESLKRSGSKVVMADIEHLIAAQEAEGYRLLINQYKRVAARNLISNIGRAPKPKGGKVGLLAAIAAAGIITYAGSASAEETPQPEETPQFEIASIEKMKQSAISEDDKKFIETISNYSALLIKWSMEDIYAKEYAISHRKTGFLDWTMGLPIGIGTFLYTDDNYEPNPSERRKEINKAITILEGQLKKNEVTLTETEREVLREAMSYMQSEAAYGESSSSRRNQTSDNPNKVAPKSLKGYQDDNSTDEQHASAIEQSVTNNDLASEHKPQQTITGDRTTTLANQVANKHAFTPVAFSIQRKEAAKSPPPIEQTEWEAHPIIQAKYSTWQQYKTVRDKVVAWGVGNPANHIEAAIAEWDASGNISGDFGANFDGDAHRSYLNLRRLYAGRGIANPGDYLDSNIVSISFFGKNTRGHKDLQSALTTAEAALIAAGHPFSPGSGTWSFVPRTQNDNINRMSNHALGRAIDINPGANPHITSSAQIKVIDAVCQDILPNGMGDETDPDVLQQASQAFQQRYDNWLTTQKETVKTQKTELTRQQTELAKRKQQEKTLKKELLKQQNSLQTLKATLKKQEQKLQHLVVSPAKRRPPDYETRLTNQKTLVDEQKVSMAKQQKLVDEQKSLLDDQDKQVRDQAKLVKDQTKTSKTEEQLLKSATSNHAALKNYAQHGFLDLPSNLIRALQAAGLSWGGEWGHEKDFMHFELPAGAAAAPAAATPTPVAAAVPAPAAASATSPSLTPIPPDLPLP